MSQLDDDDSKPWTEHDLKEALRRINAGEINLKEAENYYGISPRTIHRQRAIENMRAQLNPEKGKKLKTAAQSTTKKDVTILRKPVEISCSSIGDIVSLLNGATEEVKQLLNYECDLIYECKVCKSLFRSLLNFISHKRVYCCDMYSVIHTQNDENGDKAATNDSVKADEKLKAKEDLKEFTSRPFRITCRKDLTTVLKRITSLSQFVPTDPILHVQNIENAPCAFHQSIVPNQPAKEPTQPTVSNPSDEKDLTTSQAETKKENATKESEKTAVVVKPITFVADKRFKCPLCPTHCTTKKSVLRHLKSVHHKSEEQLERLKPRIQMIYIKKKKVLVTTKSISNSSSKSSTATTSSSSTGTKPTSTSPHATSSTNENATLPSSSVKTDQSSDKADWEKNCLLCGRHFVNRNSYASHVRICRRNMSNGGDHDLPSTSSTVSFPIVSLTPIVTSNLVSKVENNSCPKKLATMPSHTKPLAASSSSKKIGIQVRMNYCKEGVNHSVPSTLSAQSSASNSRRSSVISANRDEKSDISKSDLLNGHNTRSTSKLAHILKSLLDKHAIKDENDDPRDNKVLPVAKKMEKSQVSIYCEDCRTAYALNDFKWNSENGTPRVYKCALRDCDFRSNTKGDLLPHLSARHAVLSESDLAEVESIFIAVPTGSGKCCCHRGTSREPQLEGVKRETEKTGASNNTLKRKLNTDPNKIAKRKVAVEGMQVSAAASVKSENKTLPKNEAEIIKSKVAKKENVNSGTNSKVDQLVKNKMTSKEEDCKPRVRTKKPVLVDATLPSVVIPNGVESVLSEKGDEPSAVRMVKKTNPVAAVAKVVSKVPKMNTMLELPTISLGQEADLDPTTMSEENLKKSVMTIIFGQDMSDENVEDNAAGVREKSPSSSSTSSDGGKEKRYKFRMGKPIVPTTNKTVTSAAENKEDKVLKVQIMNKVKSVPR